MTLGALGAALVLVGAALLYMASPNQRLIASPIPPRAGWASALLVAIGTAGLLLWAGPATAIFIALTLAMLVWSVVPLAVAWLRGRREQAR